MTDRSAAMDAATQAGENVAETDVPARLDRLPWARFHWLVIFALGITWILDGLEVTLVGSLSPAIAGEHGGLGLRGDQMGWTASAYLAGAVIGALFFGWLTDRLGRKKLFTITLAIYLLGTIASGTAWDLWSFACFRFVTGTGIGGEYAAVNATIQELIPARRRGLTDLCINGSYWLGAALGGVGADTVQRLAGGGWGWRLAFVIGGVIGAGVLFVRRFVPESPRWLMTHGDPGDADAVMREIEQRVEASTGRPLPKPEGKKLRLRTDVHAWFAPAVQALFSTYKRRTILGVALMGSQAFCYNAVLFTYALILTHFYRVPDASAGLYLVPFALGNFAGPVVLGRLFDSIGRKTMITLTYVVSGVLLTATGVLFGAGALSAVGLMAAWTVTFFVASAAASSAYLTVGESFPLEVRAVAISVFYALGTGIGGIAGPAVFGSLLESGERSGIRFGHLLAGALMIGAGLVEWGLGVPAERKPLEEVAPPLSSV
jgi:MFS family permease